MWWGSNNTKGIFEKTYDMEAYYYRSFLQCIICTLYIYICICIHTYIWDFKVTCGSYFKSYGLILNRVAMAFPLYCHHNKIFSCQFFLYYMRISLQFVFPRPQVHGPKTWLLPNYIYLPLAIFWIYFLGLSFTYQDLQSSEYWRSGLVVRALSAPAEDPCLVPSTHNRHFTVA